MIQFYAPFKKFKTLKPELQGVKWNTVPYNIGAKLENDRVNIINVIKSGNSRARKPEVKQKDKVKILNNDF